MREISYRLIEKFHLFVAMDLVSQQKRTGEEDLVNLISKIKCYIGHRLIATKINMETEIL